MTMADDGVADTAAALTVALGPRSYRIVVGEGLLDEADRHVRPVLSGPRAVVVTDRNVAARYLDPVAGALGRGGIDVRTVVLPAGEGTKDLAHLGRLTDRLLDGGAERGTTVIALGGGVVGDLAGFAAAVLLRGVPFVQMPTTLLAQVDSAVGGKTGVNTRHGKNLLGAFHQPRLVLADTRALDTLPRRQLLAGYAEVVKYGLLGDAGFFDWLEAHGAAVCAGDRAAQRHAILTGCAAKAAIVAADEREAGRRALLNLGHTFGHALEAQTGFGDRLLHGEAVALGMVLAFDLSADLGLCPPGDAARARRHLASVGLATDLEGLADPDWTPEGLVRHMFSDKKVEGGRLTLILVRGIGRAFVARGVAVDRVRAAWQRALRR